MRKREEYAKDAISVVELFAGVGGFRLGLEKIKDAKGKLVYKTIWANQWEPGSGKNQHAAWVYAKKFKTTPEDFVTKNISEVLDDGVNNVPDHDLLVGGFPCQDYSVARPLNQAEGIVGKKGVLWWEIYRILKEKKTKPDYLILENVDRLLKSPASQRGRDFAIMLSSLSKIGYVVEWRVINAAEYGFPQRRRRVFIVGYRKGTSTYEKIKRMFDDNGPSAWILKEGVLSKAFPVTSKPITGHPMGTLNKDVVKLSENYNKHNPVQRPFLNAGVCCEYKFVTLETSPRPSKRKYWTLNDVLEKGPVDNSFYLSDKDSKKWQYLKGPKKAKRTKKNGHVYYYEEGGMVFPDDVERPSRTIVTGEGGSTPSRFKHVIKDQTGRLRRLTPMELERLNGFPKNFTKHKGVSDVRRAFFMGNALVVGVVNKIGRKLAEEIRPKKDALRQKRDYIKVPI